MKTSIPEKTWVSYRYRSETEYGIICQNGKAILVGNIPPIGTMVQPCVWKDKGETLEPRGKAKVYAGE